MDKLHFYANHSEGWISVQESMPPPGEHVLVLLPGADGEPDRVAGTFNGTSWHIIGLDPERLKTVRYWRRMKPSTIPTG
jgi:hypothetical protein